MRGVAEAISKMKDSKSRDSELKKEISELVEKARMHCDFNFSDEIILEQIYRANYSSSKIRYSWEDVKNSMKGILRLLGYIKRFIGTSYHNKKDLVLNSELAKKIRN